MRMPLARPAAGAALLLAVAAASLHAASPTFWQVSTQADFLKGDAVEHVAIDGEGRLVIAPRHEVLHAPTAPFLWDVLVDGTGGSIVATGNEGQVLQVGSDGTPTVLFDAPEADVHALARGPGDAVFAATSPEGRVYRLGANGTAASYFDPDDKYIWALAAGPAGALYVATGDKGYVYRVTAAGSGTRVLDTKAANATALAVDAAGQVLVGTESPGKVLRLDARGKAFVLLDAAQHEIRRLRIDAAGNVYALAVPGRGAGGETRPAERTESSTPAAAAGVTPVVSTEITVTAVGEVPVTTSPAAPRADARREARAAVYRITPDGVSDVIWDSAEDVPYDVLVDGDEVLVATGPKGKIFRVSAIPQRATLVARATAQQVTAFATARDGTRIYITSNPGQVVRLGTVRADRGVYESEIRDAGNVANWGVIRWHAVTPPGSRVELVTRSGNTARPDENWSDWSAPYPSSAGSTVTSPKARYLQWRATLHGGPAASPSLTAVTTAYLPRNLRPTIEGITVHPAGVVFQRPFSTGEAEIAGFDPATSDGRPVVPGAIGQAGATSLVGRRTFQKGLQTLQWKADDPDQDRLQYDVFYRRDGDADWKTLRTGLWDPLLTWDTTMVPDGSYSVRVVASDAPANAPGLALTTELESTTFEVDNTPPVIEQVTPVRGPSPDAAWTVVVRDAHSPIQRLEYSVDGGRWLVAFPIDGMSDARTEQFELNLTGAKPGHIVALRASDALGNVATLAVPYR
jgi:hypothetical protein